MMRWVIRDYFAAFRWQKIKKSYKNGSWWVFPYILFVLPAIFGSYDTIESTLAHFLISIPTMYCLFSAGIHPMILPKMMYLCPMSREMRRKYIEKACYFRVAFPIVLGILGVLGLYIYEIGDWIYRLGILLNLVILSIFLESGINTNGYGLFVDNDKRNEMDWCTSKGIAEIFEVILAMATSMVYSEISWDSSTPLWLKWIIVVTPVAVQLPIAIWYLKGWRSAVERAICYESSY